MARSRNIKPGFFKDARIVACSYEARLLFQGLWCMADYMGRLKYVPLEIKMEIFPADPVDVEKCMQELSSNGLIQIYTDRSGAALVQVVNFTKHQNPHINERQDRDRNPLPCLPGPEEAGSSESEEKPDIKQRVKEALVVLQEYSESDPADSLNLIPDSLNLIPDCSTPDEAGAEADKPPKSKRACQIPKDFQPNESNHKVAAEKCVSIHDELPQFVDYHRAKGSTMKDWNAALNTWLRNAAKFAGKGQGGQAKETPQQRGERMARERGLL